MNFSIWKETKLRWKQRIVESFSSNLVRRDSSVNFAQKNFHLPGVFKRFSFGRQTFVRKHRLSSENKARQSERSVRQVTVAFVSLKKKGKHRNLLRLVRFNFTITKSSTKIWIGAKTTWTRVSSAFVVISTHKRSEKPIGHASFSEYWTIRK